AGPAAGCRRSWSADGGGRRRAAGRRGLIVAHDQDDRDGGPGPGAVAARERDGGGRPTARLVPDPVAPPAGGPIVGPGDAPETDRLVAVPRPARPELV